LKESKTVTNAIRFPHVSCRLLIVGLWASAMLACLGCGEGASGPAKTFPVHGLLNYKGQSPAGAVISLHPKQPLPEGIPQPRAAVKPDGKFSVSTFNTDDGAPEGDYTLTITWYKLVERDGEHKPGPNVLPKKYAAAKTSGIEITVTPGENQLAPISL